MRAASSGGHLLVPEPRRFRARAPRKSRTLSIRTPRRPLCATCAAPMVSSPFATAGLRHRESGTPPPFTTEPMTSRTLAARSACLALLTLAADLGAQQDPFPRLIRPLDGSLMLAGQGQLTDAALDAFLHLCGGASADIAVVATKASPQSIGRWTERGAASVLPIRKRTAVDEKLALGMLEVEGVWFEDGADALVDEPLFVALVRNVLAKGGAVGGQNEGALALVSGTDDGGGLAVLPGSVVRLLDTADPDGSQRALDDALTAGDGLVGWQIPAATALVVHRGRRVAAVGAGRVVAQVAGTDDWPARRASVEAQDVFDHGDQLGYGLDLLGWLRSARDRTEPVFPPAKPPSPAIAEGTVILSGGGGVQSPTWRRFIDAAGGTGATIVCIPSAAHFSPDEKVRSYSARQLRDHGCTAVHIVHVSDPLDADRDSRTLALLEQATGVWIDGGRTFRMMDGFQNTRSAALMHAVLARGGVVGGSSAGCQVAGDFLVRGNPRSNRTLVFDGYTRGFGFMQGVIVDAHFIQRDRPEPFAELMRDYPQMLGIGVDEDTALVVTGSVAEVLGPNAVSFYDGTKAPVVLREGQTYDVAARRTQ